MIQQKIYDRNNKSYVLRYAYYMMHNICMIIVVFIFNNLRVKLPLKITLNNKLLWFTDFCDRFAVWYEQFTVTNQKSFYSVRTDCSEFPGRFLANRLWFQLINSFDYSCFQFAVIGKQNARLLWNTLQPHIVWALNADFKEIGRFT